MRSCAPRRKTSSCSEWLGLEADGEGDHLLLKVRKRGANTMWVAKQLARLGEDSIRATSASPG